VVGEILMSPDTQGSQTWVFISHGSPIVSRGRATHKARGTRNSAVDGTGPTSRRQRSAFTIRPPCLTGWTLVIDTWTGAFRHPKSKEYS
jgi:hypothetical protein